MSKSKVVIVGGGFGGLYTANYLCKNNFDVLLIDRKDYFIYTPFLPEVAIGYLEPTDAYFKYSEYFSYKNFTFFQGEVTGVDFDKQIVQIGKKNINYDYLVLATGSRFKDFDIKGAANAFPLKTLDQAIAARSAMVNLAKQIGDPVDINIVGAGVTGVELAHLANEFFSGIKKKNKNFNFRIKVFNAADRLLPDLPEKMTKYINNLCTKKHILYFNNSVITEIKPHGIVASAKEYDSELTFLTAGVTPNVEVVNQKYWDEFRNIKVDEYLRVVGYKNVFALGDIVAPIGLKTPRLAQTAIQHAKIVATNIKRTKTGNKLLAYHFFIKGILLYLGRHRAIGEIFGLILKGPIIWAVWHIVHIMTFPGWKFKLRVTRTRLRHVFR